MMTTRTADRFAQTSLALYATEGTFEMDVDAEEDLEEVALAFERLGCAVERAPLRRRVTVTAPKEAR